MIVKMKSEDENDDGSDGDPGGECDNICDDSADENDDGSDGDPEGDENDDDL